jgi:hypothetical protein
MSPENRSGYSLAVVSVGVALVVLFASAGVIAAVGHEVPKELWSAAAALSGALVGILVPPPKTKKDTAGAAPAAAAITYTGACVAAQSKADEIRARAGVSDATKTAAAAAAAEVRETGQAVEQAAVDAAASRQLGPGVVGAAIKIHEDALGTASNSVRSAQDAVNRASDASSQRRSSAPPATTADENLKVAQARQEVRQAAVSGAKQVQGDAVNVAATTGLSVSWLKETLKVALPAFVFIFSLGFGLAIAWGGIHPSGCTLTGATRVPVCDLPLIHISNQLIALASAAGGALIGLFANPPSSSAPAKQPA